MDPRLKSLRRLADELGITIVAGAPYRSTSGLNIAALVIQSGGGRAYTKHYLHSGEEMYFTPGRMGLQIEIRGEHVSFAVCADTTHPEHAEAAARLGATVYAAGVFITPNGINADSAQLRGYARDHKMVVLMANYAAPSGGFESAGRSTVWDEEGTVIIQAPGTGEALLVARREGAKMRGELFKP